MTERLNVIKNMVKPGRGVIDVGTDHGYVPIALALSGYPGIIIASDINPEPLDSAVRSAEENCVSDRISFRLGDGLHSCSSMEVDTAVIAGMGGDLICSIIDSTSWTERPDFRLILQPMTKHEVLRYYLINNGWQIDEEHPVKENGRLFQIFSAHYAGVFIQKKGQKTEKYKDAELFTGLKRMISDSVLYPEIIESEYNRLEKKLYSIYRNFYSDILLELKEMKIY